MTGPDLQRDWKHLGRALREARGRRSRAEVEQRSGVSATQIKRYEAGAVTPPVIPDKMWILATFYGWAPGSLEVVLAGGEPTYVPDEAEARVPPLTAEEMDQLLALVGSSKELTSTQKRDILRWLLAHAE